MSLFNDYSHQILHHQTEAELIQQNRADRLAREARRVEAIGAVVASADPSASSGAPCPDAIPANGARQRYAH